MTRPLARLTRLVALASPFDELASRRSVRDTHAGCAVRSLAVRVYVQPRSELRARLGELSSAPVKVDVPATGLVGLFQMRDEGSFGGPWAMRR